MWPKYKWPPPLVVQINAFEILFPLQVSPPCRRGWCMLELESRTIKPASNKQTSPKRGSGFQPETRSSRPPVRSPRKAAGLPPAAARPSPGAGSRARSRAPSSERSPGPCNRPPQQPPASGRPLPHPAVKPPRVTDSVPRLLFCAITLHRILLPSSFLFYSPPTSQACLFTPQWQLPLRGQGAGAVRKQ